MWTIAFRKTFRASSVISDGDAQNPQRNQFAWRPIATDRGPFELIPLGMYSQSGLSPSPYGSDTRP